jgi:hypothetical protein
MNNIENGIDALDDEIVYIKSPTALGAAPASTDLFTTIHDPSGTPLTRTVTGAELAEMVNAEAQLKLLMDAAVEKTIASGVVAVTQTYIKLQPESGTTDDLTSVSGMVAGQAVIFEVSDEGTDTITIKHGAGINCPGGTDIALSYGGVWGVYDGSVLKILGGGGGSASPLTTKGDVYVYGSANARLPIGTNNQVLTADSAQTLGLKWADAAAGGITYSAIAPTTSNVTLTENYDYLIDCSGLTANRNLVLPAPSAAGKEILVTIVIGDDTYNCVLIGDTGVSINGGSAATAWKYVKSAKTTVKFVSTSTSNWQVVYIHEGYGTPTYKLQAYKSGGDQNISAATWSVITMQSTVIDTIGAWNTSTSTYSVMSDGWYIISCTCAMNHGSAQDNKILSCQIKGTLLGASNTANIYDNVLGSVQYPIAAGTIQIQLHAGDSFQFEIFSQVASIALDTLARVHAEVVKLMD